MPENIWIVVFIVFILLGLAVFLTYWLTNSKRKNQLFSEQERNRFLLQQLGDLKSEKQSITGEKERLVQMHLDENILLKQNLAQRESETKNLQQRLLEEREQLKELNQKFTKEFENLANKILEEKSRKFTHQNKENLENLLKPLQEKIVGFEKKVEDTHKESLERGAALRQQIVGLKELNEQITKEASNLTKALKGDSKMQGNWGELILEKVLEKSGLEKDREYFTQQSFSTDEGRKMPDVIIDLPDGKKIIVDSKVSLVAYNEFVNSTDEAEQESQLKKHLFSIKNHVKQLSEKKYQDLYQMESPDFVLMFIPIETAFSSAINAEPDLYNQAFTKNIVIVTPSTLLATLKTVDSMWQNEKQKQNTLEISRQAAALYDKFASLLSDLEKVGNQLKTISGTYENSMKKLTGTGNLIRRVENLKKLGVKASKQIDDKWLERDNEEVD